MCGDIFVYILISRAYQPEWCTQNHKVGCFWEDRTDLRTRLERKILFNDMSFGNFDFFLILPYACLLP
jgi:hypothetical protein